MINEILYFITGNFLYFLFYIVLILNAFFIFVFLLSFLLSYNDNKNYEKRKIENSFFIKYWLNKLPKENKKNRKKIFLTILPYISKHQQLLGTYCKLKNSSKKQMKKYFKYTSISFIIFIVIYSFYDNYNTNRFNEHEPLINQTISSKNDYYKITTDKNKVIIKDIKESSEYVYIKNNEDKIIDKSRNIIVPNILINTMLLVLFIIFVIIKYISKIIL